MVALFNDGILKGVLVGFSPTFIRRSRLPLKGHSVVSPRQSVSNISIRPHLGNNRFPWPFTTLDGKIQLNVLRYPEFYRNLILAVFRESFINDCEWERSLNPSLLGVFEWRDIPDAP